eukprot:ANDGO_06170.mRNA.1 Chromatin modification-related protein EAF6
MSGSSEGVNLSQLKQRKSELEEQVRHIENQIFNLEGGYLEETWAHGNASRGWEPYLVSKSKGANPSVRRQRFKESDRIFSYSSITAERNVGDRYLAYTEKDTLPSRPIQLSFGEPELSSNAALSSSVDASNRGSGKATGKKSTGKTSRRH